MNSQEFFVDTKILGMNNLNLGTYNADVIDGNGNRLKLKDITIKQYLASKTLTTNEEENALNYFLDDSTTIYQSGRYFNSALVHYVNDISPVICSTFKYEQNPLDDEFAMRAYIS